jgi:membrane protein implicated in regulation of membrane protease activity
MPRNGHHPNWEARDFLLPAGLLSLYSTSFFWLAPVFLLALWGICNSVMLTSLYSLLDLWVIDTNLGSQLRSQKQTDRQKDERVSSDQPS